MKSSFLVSLLLGATMLSTTGCRRPAATGWQGYIEGEFVHVASPLGGRVENLAVTRGAHVEAGAPLFQLEHAAELAAQREASARLAALQARLADLQKGQRPTEIAAIEARLAQARTAAATSAREFDRQNDLFQRGVIAASVLDFARLARDRDQRLIDELSAQLSTARLGARADMIAAAEAEVASAESALARATWSVEQKSVRSPAAALVHDTIFRVGEFAAAGAPVVSLLPPANLKVRFFVPEGDYAQLQAGRKVAVRASGVKEPLSAQIVYTSPRPEYTPPVLYNRDNRAKLVFMIEAAFLPPAPGIAHPGQPVDVRLAP